MSTSGIITVGLLTGKFIDAGDIAWLWMHMTQAYGYKFIKHYGKKDHGVWLEALSDLAFEDVVFGFKKLMKTLSAQEREHRESWPPNVKEFRLYCERNLSDYGLPTANRAFSEYEKNEWRAHAEWSHAIVAETARRFKPDPDAHGGIWFSEFSKIYEALVKEYLFEVEKIDE